MAEPTNQEAEKAAMEKAWRAIYSPPRDEPPSYEFEEGWLAAREFYSAAYPQRDEAPRRWWSLKRHGPDGGWTVEHASEGAWAEAPWHTVDVVALSDVWDPYPQRDEGERK